MMETIFENSDTRSIPKWSRSLSNYYFSDQWNRYFCKLY